MKLSRLILLIIIVLLLVVSGLVAMTPSWLSGASGRNFLLKKINGSIPGKVEIGSLELAWFGGQSIGDMKFTAPDGKPVFTLDRFASEASLWAIIRKKLSLGRTEIVGFHVELATDESGVSNFQQALGVEEEKAKKERVSDRRREKIRVPLPITGEIIISDCSIRLQSMDIEPVLIHNVNGGLRSAAGTTPITLTLDGDAEQGKRTGNFKVEGTLDKFDEENILAPDHMKAQITVAASSLPVDGLDQLLQMQGLLRTALGSQLDSVIKGSVDEGKAEIAISVKTENVSAEVASKMENGQLALTKPARVTGDFTSDLLALLARDVGKEVRLARNVPFTFEIEQLDLPITGFNMRTAAFKATFAVADGKILGQAPYDGLGWGDLKAMIDSPALGQELALNFSGKALKDSEKGEFLVDAKLKDLFDSHGGFQLEGMQADAIVKLTALPAPFIEGFIGQPGLLSAALGSNINLTIASRSKGAEAIEIDVSLQTKQMQADIPLIIKENLELKNQADIRMNISPALVERFVPPEKFQLNKEAPVQLAITRIVVPRPKIGESLFQPQRMAVDANLYAADVSFTTPQTGKAGTREVRLKMDGKSLEALMFFGQVEIVQEEPKGLVHTTLGAATNLTFNGKAGIDADKVIAVPSFAISGESEKLKKLTLRGMLDPGFSRFSLSEPAIIQYALSPALLSSFMPEKKEAPVLLEEALVDLTMEKVDVQLDPVDFLKTQLSFKGSIPELRFKGAEPLGRVSLHDINLTMLAAGQENHAAIRAEGKTFYEAAKTSGLFLLDARIDNMLQKEGLDMAQARTDAKLKLDNIPVGLIEAAAGQSGELVPVIGDKIGVDMQAKLEAFSPPKGVMDISAESDRLKIDAGLGFAETLNLKRPATLSLTLTPEAFTKLLQGKTEAGSSKKVTPLVRLAKPAAIKAEVRSLTYPLLPEEEKAKVPYNNIAFAMHGSVDGLLLNHDRSKEAAGFESLNAAINTGNLAKEVTISIRGQTTASGGGAKGPITIDGRLQDIITADGTLNTKGFSTTFDAAFENAPVGWFDGLLDAGERLTAVLGDAINLKASAKLTKMSGPVSVEINATNTKANLKGTIKDTVFVLNEPFQSATTVTPKFGQVILKDVNPLLVHAVSADRPLTLAVDKKDFLVPLKPFSLKDTRIGNARIEGGTFILQNGGVLRALMNLLKRQAPEQLQAQFTPFAGHMKGGIAQYERTDITLGGNVKVASWGTIDLIHDQMDMKLGLTAVTLDKVLGIDGVSADDIVQIPVKGPTGKPRIDWSNATRQIATYTAGKSLERKAPGASKIIEKILGGGTPAPRASQPPPGQKQPQGKEQQKPSTGKTEELFPFSKELIDIFQQQKKR